ncbi:unnamed protein product [Acanthoscelides obtectus]|uniref:Serpin domain-containing protein n=2 Tax=Acanthoscelides obtectus TaxID=200917 RepID=A0A9P0LVV7_ACAOB|nr:unnamed protein product [Acanthoscelides obtectus]CAK1677809.1 Serine protease inhibitor 88Ea [Acanthoscelides obtectus]
MIGTVTIVNMQITFALLVVIAAVLRPSIQECFPQFAGNQPSRQGRTNLYSGQQEFSLALLHAINKVMPEQNLFFSPYSTYHCLLIAYFLTGNQTEGHLKKVLRLNEKENKADIYGAYKTDKFLTQLLARNASYEFTNANKIYVSDGIPINECIINDFPEELERKNFKQDPENARLSINQWVEATTHNMIKDLLPAGTVDTNTDLVLVNAAYFKGMWENRFNPDLTQQEIFYVSPSKQITVDMMHMEGTFKHDVSEALGAHILELPYKGDNISMFILLPPFSNTESSIDTTLKSLNLDTFRSVVENENLISKKVQVALPKFSLETTIELTPVLEFMGVGDLFQNSSDFSYLSEQHVSVDKSLHKAKIEVNEEGTEAAAATVLFTFRSSRPSEPAQFICNHPFIYLIYDKFQSAVLFAGVFRKPN